MDGSTVRVANVETSSPPITARPSGAACAPPSPSTDRHRQHAGNHRGRGHQNGAQPAAGAFPRRVEHRRQPSRRSRSANVTSRIEFATAIPIAMIAPMNDCTLSVVPVTNSISTTPHSTAGMVSTIASASRTD